MDKKSSGAKPESIILSDKYKRKGCWIMILLTLILNVILLQWTVEAYFGEEYEHVYLYTGIAIVSVLVALFAYFRWRRVEYK